MLLKANRLVKDQDIKKVFARGRGFFNFFFTLKYLKNPAQTRFAFVISSKVSKIAVKRNRLKRILRELVRKNLGGFEPGDYVVVLKPKSALAPEAELLESFRKLSEQARLFI